MALAFPLPSVGASAGGVGVQHRHIQPVWLLNVALGYLLSQWRLATLTLRGAGWDGAVAFTILGTPTHPARMGGSKTRFLVIGGDSLLMTAGLIVVAGVARWRMTVIVGLVTQAALMATLGGDELAWLRSSTLGVAAAAQAAATGYALQPSCESVPMDPIVRPGIPPPLAVAAHLPPRGQAAFAAHGVLSRREAARCLQCALGGGSAP